MSYGLDTIGRDREGSLGYLGLTSMKPKGTESKGNDPSACGYLLCISLISAYT